MSWSFTPGCDPLTIIKRIHFGGHSDDDDDESRDDSGEEASSNDEEQESRDDSREEASSNDNERESQDDSGEEVGSNDENRESRDDSREEAGSNDQEEDEEDSNDVDAESTGISGHWPSRHVSDLIRTVMPLQSISDNVEAKPASEPKQHGEDGPLATFDARLTAQSGVVDGKLQVFDQYMTLLDATGEVIISNLVAFPGCRQQISNGYYILVNCELSTSVAIAIEDVSFGSQYQRLLSQTGIFKASSRLNGRPTDNNGSLAGDENALKFQASTEKPKSAGSDAAVPHARQVLALPEESKRSRRQKESEHDSSENGLVALLTMGFSGLEKLLNQVASNHQDLGVQEAVTKKLTEGLMRHELQFASFCRWVGFSGTMGKARLELFVKEMLNKWLSNVKPGLTIDWTLHRGFKNAEFIRDQRFQHLMKETFPFGIPFYILGHMFLDDWKFENSCFLGRPLDCLKLDKGFLDAQAAAGPMIHQQEWILYGNVLDETIRNNPIWPGPDGKADSGRGTGLLAGEENPKTQTEVVTLILKCVLDFCSYHNGGPIPDRTQARRSLDTIEKLNSTGLSKHDVVFHFCAKRPDPVVLAFAHIVQSQCPNRRNISLGSSTITSIPRIADRLLNPIIAWLRKDQDDKNVVFVTKIPMPLKKPKALNSRRFKSTTEHIILEGGESFDDNFEL